MAEKNKLKFITYLYGLATVLVVFGHSHPLHGIYPSVFDRITGFIYTFHMPLFFLILGMLIQRSSKGRNIVEWWKNKVKRLILPYIVLSLLAFAPKILLSSVISDDMTLSFGNIVRILLIPRENIWGHFWFIPVYLICSLLGALISKYAAQNRVVLYGALAASLILNLFPIKTSWLGIEDITKMIFYVVLGIELFKIIEKKAYSIFSIGFSFVAVILSAALYILFKNEYTEKVICLLMMYAMISVSVGLQSFDFKFLSLIGDRAFTVFIYSWPIQAILEILILVVLKLGWYISYPIMFIGGLIGPLVLYQLYVKLLRPHLKHTGFTDGMLGVRK